MAEKITAYEAALKGLDRVAGLMNLSNEVVGYLKTPQRLLVVELPVRMDDGSLEFFTGYRAQHNSALGPVKGGTRFHPDETIDDVKALSFWMSIKNALANIPAGGAKGGIAVDPSKLTHTEMERLCRAYIRAIYPLIGPKVDIPGPDVGTPQYIMAWFCDEYEILSGGRNPAAFAGKPPIVGGSLGRDRATGRGLVDSAEKIMALHNERLEGKRIVLQGFGNLGAHAASFFVEQGALIVGISDVHGGIYNEKGINVKLAMECVQKEQTLANMTEVEHINNAQLLELSCDILVPCALQNQITEDNAANIRARFIMEGANGPTTPNAESILLDKGVCIVPDIVSNVGGAVVAYFEMVQDLYHYYWKEDEVFDKLKVIMQKTTGEVYNIAKEKNICMRDAAWMSAFDKIIAAMKLRGWVRK